MAGGVVILGGRDLATRIVINDLRRSFSIEAAILEAPASKKKLLKNRVKKLGLPTVVGQVGFQLWTRLYLARESAERVQEIKQIYALDDSPLDPDLVTLVPSVNSQTTIDLLKKLRPKVVVVHGTRIISRKVLSEISGPAINMHAGITPLYRGVHGGYWALVKGERKNCGVTVHLVDAGIDTGSVLYQSPIEINEKDNFVSYPYLQLANGLPLLKRAIEDGLKDRITPTSGPQGESALYYHPTLATYLRFRVGQGIR